MGKKNQKQAQKPSFSEQERQQYNYAVLGRHDPQLYQIFFTSAICYAYQFDIEESKWEKLNYLGTLFVYSRITRDEEDIGDAQRCPYALMILNRDNTQNFSLGITPLSVSTARQTPEMDIKLEGEYIMIQTADDIMYGLWLFNQEDREPVAKTLEWCLNAETQT